MNNVFPESLQISDDPKVAVQDMERYIKYMCERIDFALGSNKASAEVPVTDLAQRVTTLEQSEAVTDVKATDALRNSTQALNGLNNKVDKETGKGLSTNDYTTAEQNKLAGLVEVEANPSATPTDALTSVGIDGTVYGIAGSGGGVDSVNGQTGTVNLDAYDIPYNQTESVGNKLSILPSHVGMVIHSTTLSTLASVRNLYGSNTTWIQHTGYMLRGAASSVTANSANSDGGADSVTPSGTNSGGVVKGTTLTAAQSGVPAHSHGLNNHTHGAGTLGGSAKNGGSWKIVAKMIQYNTSDSQLMNVSGTNISTVEASVPRRGTNTYTTLSGGKSGVEHTGHTHSLSITGSTGGSSASTANNTAADASAAHDHPFTNPTFTGTAHTNIPKYKNVYIWERTA